MFSKRRLLLVAIAIWPIASSEATEVKLDPGENLLVPLIEGWKLGWATKRPGLVMSEFVPRDETVHTWTQIVTVQIFTGQTSLHPIAFSSLMFQRFRAGCRELGDEGPLPGNVNGYLSARIALACTRETKSGKGSFTLVLSFAGKDSFYVVQRAWRGEPFDLDKLPASTRSGRSGWRFSGPCNCATRGAATTRAT